MRDHARLIEVLESVNDTVDGMARLHCLDAAASLKGEALIHDGIAIKRIRRGIAMCGFSPHIRELLTEAAAHLEGQAS